MSSEDRRTRFGDPDRNGNAAGESRRTVLIGGAALALGSSLKTDAFAASEKPERLALQAGDRFQIAKGPLKGQTLRPEMLTVGEAPMEGFPLEPEGEVLRRGNRLNRILALRLDPAEMDDPTRENGVEGILVYSAICTHKNCTIQSWMPEERHLRCHCHLSEFAALSEGSVMAGPARRQLPMVPLGLDDEGFVIAQGGFTRKPGGSA